jgi:nucleoside-diphosphate-sugar epimerase
MRILVTGATGFLGVAFTRLALKCGHEIGGMMLPTESPPSRVPPGPGLTWLRGTLVEPPWTEIEQFKPEVCVHFAWIATPGVYLESPENRNYFEWSLEFVRRIRGFGARHIIGIGTCVEYEISHAALSEARTPIVPTTNYARYKNELRLALERDSRANDFKFCWSRVFYPYGVGEHPARLCSSIIRKLSRDEKIVLKTPDSTKDYIYIEDLAEALLMLVEKEVQGTINLGTGIPISVKDIAHTLGQLMGKPQLIEEVVPPQIDPLGYVVADASRLRELGWQPRHNLTQGLERLLEANRTTVGKGP